MATSVFAELSEAAREFAVSLQRSTQTYTDDYRRDPPPNKTPAEIDAYCEGFQEAVEMFATVYLAHRFTKGLSR